MKNILAIILICSVFSCNQPEDRIQVVEDTNLSQKQIDSVLQEYSFEYDRLKFIDSTDYAIIPISTEKPRGGTRLTKSSYKADSYPQYWNIIHLNTITNETKLLTNKKMRISHFVTNMSEFGPVLSKSILYKIADTDFNSDKKLTAGDPENLFISEIDGNNLRRLTPKNEHLKEFYIVPNTDRIIVKTLRDANGDLEFDRTDEVIWYIINLDETGNPAEILNEGERKEIENLYFEQWLVKNNKA